MTPRDPFNEGEQAAKARRGRSLAIAGALVLFILLVFAVTLIRLTANVSVQHF
jgi:hypothetical protein